MMYMRTFNFGYVLDDDVVYRHNSYVQEGLAGIPDIVSHGFIHGFNRTNDQSYRPVVLVVFAFQKQLWDNNPKYQHRFNVLLYGLCGFLLWLILVRLFRNRHPAVPILMTLIFLAHPAHTEVVANIKGLDDLLHFLFVMGALLFSLRFADAKKWLDLGLSCLLFMLALLSKEMAITFLAIIPLTLYFFTEAKLKGIATATVPLVLVWAAYMGLRVVVLDEVTFQEGEGGMKVINNALAAADGNPLMRYSTCLVILALYVKLAFFPHPLSWEWGFNQIPIVGPGDWQTIVSALVLIGLAAYAVIGFRKRDPLAWAILFFFITISIVSNFFILIGATFAERFVFTPSVGFAVGLVLLLGKLPNVDLSAPRLSRNLVFTIPLAVFIIAFAAKTFDRSKDWKDADTLYLSALDAAPNSSRVVSAVASVYRGRAEKAQQVKNIGVAQTNYTKAIQYYKESIDILHDNFDSWYNLGVSYQQSGQPDKAMEAYQTVVEIEPNMANAWNNIGSLYFNNEKNYDKAKESFGKVIEVAPQHVDALVNLGACYHNTGDRQRAIGYYRQALNVNHQHPNALNNIVQAYSQLGMADSVAYYQQFLGGQR